MDKWAEGQHLAYHSTLQASEVGLEGASATPTAALSECRPTQEATTATQTEAGVFSLHPQRPTLHAGHNFSLTSGVAAIHPVPPPPVPETTPVESSWQAPPPPPAPLPSPNHNPGVGEAMSESSACGGGPLPVVQAGVWGAEGVTSPTTPLGTSRGEAEQEEAMMDDLGEPTLVHTLAEADQSQGESLLLLEKLVHHWLKLTSHKASSLLLWRN